MSALRLNDGDYFLREGAAWFTVKNFSIRIHATDEGVAVDVYSLGREEEPIASTWALDADTEEDQ